jgi:hypothetical protein
MSDLKIIFPAVRHFLDLFAKSVNGSGGYAYLSSKQVSPALSLALRAQARHIY